MNPARKRTWNTGVISKDGKVVVAVADPKSDAIILREKGSHGGGVKFPLRLMWARAEQLLEGSLALVEPEREAGKEAA